MATNTYVALDTKTVTSAVSSVTFTSIPQGYTDLVIVCSVSSTATANILLRFGNGSIDTASNYSNTFVYGTGSAAGSSRTSSQTSLYAGAVGASSEFALSTIHIQNYSNATTYKTFLSRFAWISSAVYATVGLWRSTSAVNTLTLTSDGTNFAAGSTFTIYGIAADDGTYSAKATGGTITADQFYVYHTFTSSGTFAPTSSVNADILVVAGGGGSYTSPGGGGSGGGGAGGLLGFTSQSLTPSSYTVTVGAGGTDANGSNSQFGSLTAAVGGGRGGAADTIGSVGGSGGGTGFRTPAGPAAGTSGQGYAGGNTSGSYPNFNSGGGGGAGAAGGTGNTNGGAGGVGSNAYSAWATATSTGHSGYYAGGGGGMIWYPSGSPGAGGTGGGGTGASTSTGTGSNGLANTGGGAGGSAQTATSGGSGIVIVRYLK